MIPPFLFPLIGLVAGILAGYFLNMPVWSSLPFVAGALAYYWFLLKHSGNPVISLKKSRLHYVWITLLFTGVGIFTESNHHPLFLPPEDLSNISAVEGMVTKVETKATGDILQMDITQTYDSANVATTRHGLRIITYTDGFTTRPGDVLTIKGTLYEITDSKNRRPSGYKEKMNRSGFRYRIYANCDDIQKVAHANTLRSIASEYTLRIESTIEYSGLSKDAGAFISAMLLGDKTMLDSEQRLLFNNTGTAHILALSGMHVAIIASVILFLLIPLRFLGWHRTRKWIALVAIWMYAFFTGFSPSTVRACVMATFLLWASSLERKYSGLNALLAAAFAILLFSPLSVFDVGMQLSFICVASIICFAETLNPADRHLHPVTYRVISSVTITLCAFMSTWAMVSHYFGRIPLLFLPGNLLIVPLLPFYIWAALGYLVSLSLGYDPYPLQYILNKGHELMCHIFRFLSMDGNVTIHHTMNLPATFLWMSAILTAALSIRKIHYGPDSGKTINYKLGLSLSLVMMSMAVALGFVQTEKTPDGVIIQKNHDFITFACYVNDKEIIDTIPRNKVTTIKMGDVEITVADSKTIRAQSDVFMNDNHNSRIADHRTRRFLVIGQGAAGISIADIPNLNLYEKIILHPSISRRMEQKINAEVIESGLLKPYCIRTEGPVEIIFHNLQEGCINDDVDL